MSRGATLSIMGLYNHDDTVFDLMHFPEGFTDDDKTAVKDNILIECAELECLYPNPTVMKNVIGIWSYKELPYWQRVYNASLLEYNAIENYRRMETETIQDGKTEEHSGSDVNRAGGTDALARTGTDTATDSGTEALARTGSDTSTDSGTEALARTGTVTSAATGTDSSTVESTTETEQGGNDTTGHDITGFDSMQLVNNTQDQTTYGKTEDVDTTTDTDITYGRTDTQTNNTTDTTTFGKVNTQQHNTTDTTTFGKVNTQQHNTTDTTTYGKTDTFQHGEKIEHEGTSERSVLAYGNIGVTTSQQMLTQELDIAKIINVIPIIVESFKDRFCLMVY